jgi:hypothetical protein
VSSSGMSTTAAQPPAVGGRRRWNHHRHSCRLCGRVAATASCCDPVATAVPRGGSPIAAALHAARGALDEHRLVGTDASDLSTLAGVGAEYGPDTNQ